MLKHTPFQEVIPDNSRYGIIALLPPSAQCLNRRTQVMPQEESRASGRAAEIFNRAFPERFRGEAFMWECDGTNRPTELRLAQLLRQHGVTGWRRHQPVFGMLVSFSPSSSWQCLWTAVSGMAACSTRRSRGTTRRSGGASLPGTRLATG